jgi:protein SCO1/2
VAVLVLAGCGAVAPEPELERFSTIGDFTLTSQSGEPFVSSAELAGKVWIADFIFTTCTGPCPRMSAWMARIQEDLADIGNLRLVSFTVDPENDTPEVLAEYAERYQAEPGRWFLLTGAQEALHELKRDRFLLGDVDLSLNHSTRFALVDAEGVVRGYYRSAETEQMEKLMADTRRLAAGS